MTSNRFSVSSALVLGLSVGFVAALSPACSGKSPVQRCNADTCPEGCCDTATQECFLGTTPAACGIAGASCQVCNPATQVCNQGNCRLIGSAGGGAGGGTGGSGGGSGGGATGGGDAGTCGPGSCNGCCSANGLCITAQSFNTCGKAGAACAACPVGNACVQGACIAAVCNQCRDLSGNCRGGPTDNDFCGFDGGSCLRCNTANGESCTGGVCVGTIVACDSSNCADGCCAGSICVRPDGGNPNAQCGLNASACQTCTNSTCTDGTCVGGGNGNDGGTFNLDGGLPGSCGANQCTDFLDLLNGGSGCFDVGQACSTQGSTCDGATHQCCFDFLGTPVCI